MYKKAFSTVAVMNESYSNIFKACKKYGLSGVEIRAGNDGSICCCLNKEDILTLKNTAEEYGVEITNIGSSACFINYNKQTLDYAKDMVNKTHLCGSCGMRIFLGNFAKRRTTEIAYIDYNGIVKVLKELCSYAKKKNVEIWVETHNEFATGKVLKKLIDDVNEENLKIIWDIIHPIEDGEEIETTWSYVGRYISHVHIKDGYDRKDNNWHDYCYTPLGEGELPIAEILDLLKLNKYNGFISFEWESLWREELKDYDNSLEYILKQYTNYINMYEK